MEESCRAPQIHHVLASTHFAHLLHILKGISMTKFLTTLHLLSGDRNRDKVRDQDRDGVGDMAYS